MKRMLIIMLCFVGPSLASAQTFNREQIVGTWTCKEVSYAEKLPQTGETNAIVEKTKRGLIHAQFIFKPNGIFLVRLPANAPKEFNELESMNNKMWHIKAKERMVFVGPFDEDLMTINVKSVSGSYYFLIQDTPLVLKMERGR